MNKLKSNELIEIVGGSDFLTATFINSISKCIDALLEVGRSIGSAIRRITSNNLCS